jgi:hypothetical protein
MIPSRVARLSLLMAVFVFGLGACASREEWAEWRSHSSHFASNEHMGFSLKNQGSKPRVSRQDLRVAGAQSWWGRTVIARPDQIFEN